MSDWKSLLLFLFWILSFVVGLSGLVWFIYDHASIR